MRAFAIPYKCALLLLACAMFIVPLSSFAKEGMPRGGPPAGTLKFGVLPVIQALPLFVASEAGFFKNEGLDVELTTFNSALEKDVAFTSGQISGYFGDLQTCIVLNGNGAPIKIVAEVYNATAKGRRTFALLVSPKFASKGLKDASSAGVAVSSNTILDYLTTKFLASRGIGLDRTHMVEMKNIPIRMQMLLGGQVPAAVLPEPLATLAESKGARVLADDAGTGLSSTVLAFNETFLNASPERARAFLRAVDRASAFITARPDDARPVMIRECRIPDELRKSFPVPEFPKLTLPSPSHVDDVYQWLSQKGSVKRELTYRQMVADGYIP
ncbi:MAG TPA: ABC transporter substrate-binding protein [Syntrophorhabdales bacterium]|nr:ABC transporter substrate-binding protein [Syntrophorhabdales bacterium]